MTLRNITALAACALLIAANTPATAQERAPEIAPGGTVVLRGSTPANVASRPLPPGSSNPVDTAPRYHRPLCHPVDGISADLIPGLTRVD
jgi:hypothetical protein